MIQKMCIQSLGQEDSPGEENGNLLQCSFWESSWTEKPGGLQSMGSKEGRTWHSDFLLYGSSVMHNSLPPHGLQPTRLSCPSPSPGVCSNLYPFNQSCHWTISSSVIAFSSCLRSFPASGSIQWIYESALRMRWLEYCSFSFSISPSNEYLGLSSFRNELVWSPCCSRASQESSPTPQVKSISSSMLSFLYSSTLTSIHTWLLEKL